MKQKKIAIIGAGSVGSTTAYALMLKDVVAELILVDINEQRCRGEILDLADALPLCKTSKIRTGSAQDVQQADIIIIAAGARQQPNQERTQLLKTNKAVIKSIFETITPLAPHAIVIMVTNPVDILTYYAQQWAQLPPAQVFGTGTLLDTQRLRGILSNRLSIATQSIHAYILAEHGA